MSTGVPLFDRNVEELRGLKPQAEDAATSMTSCVVGEAAVLYSQEWVSCMPKEESAAVSSCSVMFESAGRDGAIPDLVEGCCAASILAAI